MKRMILILLFLITACGKPAPDESDLQDGILEALNSQSRAWNNGNWDGYMEYYLRGDKLTFHSGKNLLQGWEKLDAMYKSKYAGANRGTLTFSDIKINLLSDSSAYVLGSWNVALPDTVKNGRFTLIFRKRGAVWRIVHDHSS